MQSTIERVQHTIHVTKATRTSNPVGVEGESSANTALVETLRRDTRLLCTARPTTTALSLTQELNRNFCARGDICAALLIFMVHILINDVDTLPSRQRPATPTHASCRYHCCWVLSRAALGGLSHGVHWVGRWLHPRRSWRVLTLCCPVLWV